LEAVFREVYVRHLQDIFFYSVTQSMEKSLAILMGGMGIPIFIMDKDKREIWSLREITKL
jgi:hypothetical protein